MVFTRALRPMRAKKASGPVFTIVLANSKNSSCACFAASINP